MTDARRSGAAALARARSVLLAIARRSLAVGRRAAAGETTDPPHARPRRHHRGALGRLDRGARRRAGVASRAGTSSITTRWRRPRRARAEQATGWPRSSSPTAWRVAATARRHRRLPPHQLPRDEPDQPARDALLPGRALRHHPRRRRGRRSTSAPRRATSRSALAELADRATFLDGRAAAARVPTPELLSTEQFEDDDPAIAALPDGSLAVGLGRLRGRGGPRPAARAPRRALERADRSDASARRSLSLLARGRRRGRALGVLERARRRGPGRVVRAPATMRRAALPRPESGEWAGSNLFHRAAARDGHLFVAWQSLFAAPDRRGLERHLAARAPPAASGATRCGSASRRGATGSPRWRPGPGGSAYVAWDTYDRGNYDVMFRAYRGGRLEALQRVTSSARFEAQADVAVDPQGRPWIAWNESGVNWGKDQGFLINAADGDAAPSGALGARRDVGRRALRGARAPSCRSSISTDCSRTSRSRASRSTGAARSPSSSATGRGRCRAASARSRSGRAGSRGSPTARGRGRCRCRRRAARSRSWRR